MQTKKLISTLVKVAVSAALLGYSGLAGLCTTSSFQDLAGQPKNWPLLLWALPLCLVAVTVTILRWQLLVRTLGLNFTTRDALRAGFLGYPVNLIRRWDWWAAIR